MTHSPSPSRGPAGRWWLAFGILFAAYQLPEGLGINVLMLSALPLAWLAGRALGFRGLDAWYLSRSPRWLVLLIITFLLAIAAKAAALAAGDAVGVYNIESVSATAARLAAQLPMMLLFTFIPSISEDILTRGFIKRALPELGARWLFVPVSAALYVLNHIYRLGNGPLEWLMLFCFGLAYAAALQYTGSLWPAVGLHWGWNFANQFADQALRVERLSDSGSALISAAAHLLLLAIVLATAALKLIRSGSYRTGMS